MHYNSQGNAHTKRWIFRQLQKTGKDGVDVTLDGKSFQIRAVATGKA